MDPQPLAASEHKNLAPREEAPTVVARAAHKVARAPTELSTSGGTSRATAGLLHREEAARARNFGRVIALLCAMTLPLLMPLGGPRRLQLATATMLALLLSVALWIWLHAGASARYSPRAFRLFGWTAVATSAVLCCYLGLFSPAPAAVTLGITFFGSGSDRRFAHGLSLTATGLWFLAALAVLAGVLPDQGVFAMGREALMPRLAMLVLVPAVLLATLWQARVTRRTTLLAMQRAQDALREASRREALLQEVHRELDVAQRAGAGAPGHYTGHRAGSYLLGAVLGRGAMGEVYRGDDEQGSQVAVKVLSAHAAMDEDLRARFEREVQLTSALSSPNVARTFGAGALADGSPYMVMELLEGSDLAGILRQRRQLTLGEVVTLATEAARGLDAAHAAGVVHRDIKPHNLFRAEREGGAVWKVLDFGVAGRSSGDGTLTQRALVGTPGYMSPEQASGESMDGRSDVFSLAAVLYRALTGRPPFAGEDTPQVLYAIVYKAPLRPRELVDKLPDDVELVLALGLEKKPRERLATAGELAAALAAAARGELGPVLRARAERLLRAQPFASRKLSDDA